MPRTLTLLGVAVLFLLAIGLVVLAEASSGNGVRIHNDSAYFLVRQGVWLVISVVCMLPAIFVDYHLWRTRPSLTAVVYLAVLAMMVAVLFLPEIKGSHRWIAIKHPMRFQIQPSELAKLVTVIATAVFLDVVGLRIERFWRGTCCAALLVGVFAALAIVEPDFGSAMVISAVGGVLFLLSGMKFLHMGALLLGGVGVGGTMLLLNANRMYRMAGWLPEGVANLLGITPEMMAASVEKGSTHQFDMAQIAIGNGGLFGSIGSQGRPFGALQSLGFLPEAHTDCIFAIGAEDWGLVFSLLTIALYLTIFVCGVMIALRAPDRLGRLIAFGMTFLIVFQALFNIGVVSGVMPPKGMALPLLSYGGTNLVVALLAVGMIFNVGRQIGLSKSRPRSTMSFTNSTQGGY